MGQVAAAVVAAAELQQELLVLAVLASFPLTLLLQNLAESQ
jgi:hypothetical protein